MYYFITYWPFFSECWFNGVLECMSLTYQKVIWGVKIHFKIWLTTICTRIWRCRREKPCEACHIGQVLIIHKLCLLIAMATMVRRRLGVTPGHFFQLGGDCDGRLLLRRRGFLQRPETREGRDAEHVLLSDLVEMGEGERSHGIDGLCMREKLTVHWLVTKDIKRKVMNKNCTSPFSYECSEKLEE